MENEEKIARMMLTAPDLLACLKSTVSQLEYQISCGDIPTEGTALVKIVLNMKHVIAKAEGETL